MEEQQIPKSEEGKITPPTSSHESLFGALLFGMMILLTLGAVGLIGWSAYRGFRVTEERGALPSIATLPAQEAAGEKTSETVPVSESKEVVPVVSAEESLKKARATDIKVLNGGAAKGSASVAADILKKDGCTKVTTGNTTSDYVGVTVYFLSAFEQEAGVVKNFLIKTYPKVTTKVAPKENKETTQASLVVILGK